jgi:hypothetical protein
MATTSSVHTPSISCSFVHWDELQWPIAVSEQTTIDVDLELGFEERITVNFLLRV